MATRTHQRFLALFLALLFLATSSVVTIAVIMQIRKDNKQEKQNNDLQAVADQLKTQVNPQPPKETPKEGALQGTKLADFTPVSSVPALQKVDTVQGSGPEVQPGEKVTAHYTGALAKDGTIFQSSHDRGQPVPFSLTGVIKGWTEGVPGMKVGGKRRLLIPAALAYGSNPPAGSGIPADADLVFDIELVSIDK